MKHWVDELADKLLEWWGEELKEPIILNGGLSVSGLQHVGRLRGEITLNSALKRALEEKGYRVEQYLTLYTQDEWKGKPPQLAMFKESEEAKRYIGWRLIDVPDPKGCHDNWVDHFWEDFGGYLDKFAEDVKVVTTTEMYESSLKKYVKEAIEKSNEVRLIINKYRKRKPFPEGWIPFQVRCESCKKIGRSKILNVDLDKFEVEYKCEHCGYHGKTSLENGKLNWRIEWAAIWAALNVHFEPYGKDHATPGGSRDSAKELSIKIFNRKPPFGAAYEWVGEIMPNGEKKIMGSSDFSGFTPRQWYEVAEPEVIRYFYLINEPMKQVFLGLHLIPQYYNMFDDAESIYFGEEKEEDVEREKLIKRSYELSLLYPIPKKKPVRVPFDHLALVVQTVPEENIVNSVVEKLKKTILKNIDLTDLDMYLLRERIIRAKNWVAKYAPETIKFEIISSDEIRENIDNIKEMLGKNIPLFEELYQKLKKLEDWNSENIKTEMQSVTSKLPSKKQMKKFFGALYYTFLGKPYGPRIAPLLESLGKSSVIERLEYILKALREA